MMRVLVTGAAGFIGMHVVERLIGQGYETVGIDNLNDYYEVALKESRLDQLLEYPGFTFYRIDIADQMDVEKVFAENKITHVVHLAAQAGVRYSLQNPQSYVSSNIKGFVNILESCKDHEIQHLVYASSSSVYGTIEKYPYSEHESIDHPASLYAATKKSNELFAHVYSHVYGLPTTGLRFFTVYGPWGRPDMAPMIFSRAIMRGEPINVFNAGNMLRDFTFIDDIVEGVVRILHQPAQPDPEFDRKQPDPASSDVPYRIYNIGNQTPIPLNTFISALERGLGRKAVKNLLPMQPGDVQATCADMTELQKAIDFRPRVGLEEGIQRFLDWFEWYETSHLLQASSIKQSYL